MASMNEGARVSMPAPQTVPSMQYVPQASQHLAPSGHPSQRPVFQGQPFRRSRRRHA